MIELTSMDWTRAALANADAEGLTLQDVVAMAEHAEAPEDLDRAVNELLRTLNG